MSYKPVVFLLGPIVRILLRGGVPWADFAELSKEVYVDIARRDYGIQGRPTNLARVAMITGLSRREAGRVRKVLEDRTEAAPPAEDRISRILTGWHLDPDFQQASGRPALLAPEGDEPTIGGLFKKYAGDLPHGAMLKELLQLGLVEAAEDGRFRVLARDYVRTSQDPAIVRQMGIALHDHGNTLAHNVNQDRTKPARFEGMATNQKVNRRYSRTFEKLIEERGTAFLEEIDEWLSRHEVNEERNPTSAHTPDGCGAVFDLRRRKEEVRNDGHEKTPTINGFGRCRCDTRRLRRRRRIRHGGN